MSASAQQQPPVLELEGLGWQVGASPILDDLGLALAAGEICALLGPSGSGKTSVLRSVMGLATPQRGRIAVDGRVLTADGRLLVPPAQRPIAFLFQNFTLFPHLDVKQNILIGIQRLERAERKRRFERLVALLRIEHLVPRAVHDLSGGEQQRVALARTLALEPRLLLLDEPFSNLDKMTRFALYHDVQALLREAGISALLATHDQEEACFFADRMAVMDRGRIVACDRPRRLYEEPASEWLARFTGRAQVLSGAELASAFAWNGGQPAARYLLRPEQIALEAGPATPAATIEAIAYFGVYSLIELRLADGLRLSAAVMGRHLHAVGAAVGLGLRWPPVELSA